MLVRLSRRVVGTFDHVEGLGRVATEFLCVDAIPLVPLRSVLVLDGGAHVEVPLSLRAVALVYLRMLALVVSVSPILFAVSLGSAWSRSPMPLVGVVTLVVLALAIAGATWLLGRAFRHASTRREAELRTRAVACSATR